MCVLVYIDLDKEGRGGGWKRGKLLERLTLILGVFTKSFSHQGIDVLNIKQQRLSRFSKIP